MSFLSSLSFSLALFQMESRMCVRGTALLESVSFPHITSRLWIMRFTAFASINFNCANVAPSECLSLACSFTCIFTSALTFVPNFFPYTAPHYTLYLLLSTPVFTGSLTLNSFSVKCLPNVASLYTTGFRLSEASPYFPLRWSSHYETESKNAESWCTLPLMAWALLPYQLMGSQLVSMHLMPIDGILNASSYGLINRQCWRDACVSCLQGEASLRVGAWRCHRSSPLHLVDLIELSLSRIH